jgi:hypothetical protein
MANKNHSITEIYKESKSLTEIDFILRDKMLGKNWSENEERFGQITLNNDHKNWQGESHPISIDDVIKTLESFKKKGCNYVEIMYHCDHIGYYFNGLDIHRSTNEEVAKDKERLDAKSKAKKEAEIKALETKLEQLKKS